MAASKPNRKASRSLASKDANAKGFNARRVKLAAQEGLHRGDSFERKGRGGAATRGRGGKSSSRGKG